MSDPNYDEIDTAFPVMHRGATLDIAVLITVSFDEKNGLLDAIEDISRNFGADSYGFEVRAVYPVTAEDAL